MPGLIKKCSWIIAHGAGCSDSTLLRDAVKRHVLNVVPGEVLLEAAIAREIIHSYNEFEAAYVSNVGKASELLIQTEQGEWVWVITQQKAEIHVESLLQRQSSLP